MISLLICNCVVSTNVVKFLAYDYEFLSYVLPLQLHYNTAQLLSELVRIGRESMSQHSNQDDLDPLLTAIER